MRIKCQKSTKGKSKGKREMRLKKKKKILGKKNLKNELKIIEKKEKKKNKCRRGNSKYAVS